MIKLPFQTWLNLAVRLVVFLFPDSLRNEIIELTGYKGDTKELISSY